jgi:hypothetical protein
MVFEQCCFQCSQSDERAVIEHALYNSKADVYSFGIVLWELCARDVPFADVTVEYEIAAAVLLRNERPPMPSYVPPGTVFFRVPVSENAWLMATVELAQIIRMCWAPRADERPSMDWVHSVATAN